jgi:hypothetical protein
VVSSGGDIGRQAVALRRCATRHCNAVAAEHVMVMRAQRMGSRMDAGTMAI